MRDFKLILPLPRAIRIGFWLCLGLYVLSFFLPADAERTNEKGYSLFVAGIWGLMVAICALLSAIGEGVRLSEVLHIWLAVTPWLANVVFWFALAHYGMGNGRPALRRAVWAALLATVVFLVPGSWYRPAGLPLSPAYWVWLGSMACLALFSALLVRHEERYQFPAELEEGLQHWSAPQGAPTAIQRGPRRDDAIRSTSVLACAAPSTSEDACATS